MDNRLPGQYVSRYRTPSRPPPFQNLPSPAYPEYRPLESNPYPPRYYPLLQQPSLPYLQNDASMPHYQHAQPLPMSQTVSGIPGLSHPGTYAGIQQYPPLHYNSPSLVAFPRQFQRNANQWYYGPVPSTDTFPIQTQPHFPIGYVHSPTQHLRRDPSILQSPDMEHLLCSPSLGPSSSSIVTTASRGTNSPPIHGLPEQFSAQDLPKTDTFTREASSRLASTSLRDRSPSRPSAHRNYLPNPPHNRSEWVMWVGNVPSDTTHDELWLFFRNYPPKSSETQRGGDVEDSGLVSIFLISRSNCAFVNYDSEENLKRAIAQFNGRQLRLDSRRCPRLVCRARRKEDDLRAGVGGQRGIGMHTRHVKNSPQKSGESAGDKLSKDPQFGVVMPSDLSALKDEEPSPPKLDNAQEAGSRDPTRSSSSYASTSSSLLAHHFPKRFFILKSLTQYALNLSVRRGMWATQKHNEAILDQAYRTSKEVVLIFSVNKSGEFYGYARMASCIYQNNNNVSWTSCPDPSSSRFLSHDMLEQCESPSRLNSTVDPASPESKLTDTSTCAPASDDPDDDCPAADGPSQTKPTQVRRSAPPAFNRDCESPLHPKPPLRSHFSCSNAGWPVSAQLPRGRESSSGSPTEAGKRLGAGSRSRGSGASADEAGGRGSQLQPVMEEGHGEGGVEESVPLEPTSGSLLKTKTPPARRSQAARQEEGQEGETSWGETFKVEWVRIERVPFHRARHLRNPWNHGREIKVARDGTEVEPGVGQQLIEEWPKLAAAGRRGTQQTGQGP